MKKTNFLKGLSAKLALAVVAFGAVLASCTKEEFNVEYKANNAQIYFNPTVIDAATNTIVANATLTGAETIVGNPNIAAGSVTITATVNEVSGSAIVSYGEVPAGSVVTYSPIIMLSSEFELVKESEKEAGSTTIKGEGTQGHNHNGTNWNYNASDYFVKFTPKWDITRENKVISSEVYASSISLSKFLKDLTLNKAIQIKGEHSYDISAWSMYRADLIINSKDVTYNINSKATKETVAVVVVNEPLSNAVCKLIEEAIPGHEGHYQHGHGHSHGHGDSTNAGGGITWAE